MQLQLREKETSRAPTFKFINNSSDNTTRKFNLKRNIKYKDCLLIEFYKT